MPVEQLSGVAVVIIIAVCVEAFIVLLIFARRQIMRFGLRNRRGPHTHIGQGGPKSLRREIDRKLEYVPYIKHEPPLPISNFDGHRSEHYYRVRALEDYRVFEKELTRNFPSFARLPGTNIRSFLSSCLLGPLVGIEPRLVHQVCDDYYDARHHHQDFDSRKYEKYALRLEMLKKQIRKLPKVAPIQEEVESGSNSSLTQRLIKDCKKEYMDSSPNQIESSAILMDSEMRSVSTAV